MRSLGVRAVLLAACLAGVLFSYVPAHADDYNAYFFILAQGGDKQVTASDAEVDRLLTQLQSPDKYVRWIAAGALGQTGSPRAVDPLLKAFKDKSYKVRAAAMLSFGNIKDPRAIRPLIESMGDPDIIDPRFSTYPILAMGKSAVEPLISEFNDPKGLNPRLLQLFSVYSSMGEQDVSDFKDPRLVEIALKSFKGAEGDIPQSLLPTMMFVVDDKALDTLLKAATDTDEGVRAAAITGLGLLEDPRAIQALRDAVKDKSQMCRDAAVQALKFKRDPGLDDAIADQLANEKDDSVIAERLEMMLEKAPQGDKLVDVLANILETKSYGDIRMFAASLLASSRNPRALEALQKLSKSQNPDVKSAAETALQNREEPGEEEQSEADINRMSYQLAAELGLPKEKSASAAKELLDQSVQPGSEEGDRIPYDVAQMGEVAVQPTLDALKSPTAALRRTACLVFCMLKDTRSVSPLLGALKDKNLGVRSAATKALGVQKGNSSVVPLTACLKDAEPSIRANAAWSLGKLGDKSAVTPLLPLLKDKNRRVQVCAATSLGCLGDKHGLSTIQSVLYMNTPESQHLGDLWGAAVRAEAGLKDANAVETILQQWSGIAESLGHTPISSEPDQSIDETCSAALKSITGQDFGCSIYRWTAWALAEKKMSPQDDMEDSTSFEDLEPMDD